MSKKPNILSILLNRSIPDGVTGDLIDIILPAAFWSWVRLSLLQKWVPGVSLGGGLKAAGA